MNGNLIRACSDTLGAVYHDSPFGEHLKTAENRAATRFSDLEYPRLARRGFFDCHLRLEF